MKIVNKAIKKVYRFNCPICGARLEADPEEMTDIGNKMSSFHCPVCMDFRYIGWRDLIKKVIYEKES